jgi:hypothetical protein
VTDAAWSGDDKCAVVATSDGQLRVLDGEGLSSTAALIVPGPTLTTPYVLDARSALLLKVALLRGTQMLSPVEGVLHAALAAMAESVMDAVAGAGSYAQRALTVAAWYGDALEQDVWEVVLNRNFAARYNQSLIRFDSGESEAALQQPLSAPAGDMPWTFCKPIAPAKSLQPLAARLGVLRPNEEVHLTHVVHTAAMDQRRAPTDQQALHVCADRFVAHGDKQNAIRVLLGSDPSSPSYLADSLMSCVIAAASGGLKEREREIERERQRQRERERVILRRGAKMTTWRTCVL